jgi:protein SCO1/2
VTRLVTLAIIALSLATAAPSYAAVTQRELAEVGVTPTPGATLPLDSPLRGEDGATKPLRFWLGEKPGVMVLADYTCETLCRPVISIVADALSRSGLMAGADFRFIVIGLDPKDTTADAAHMKQAQLGQNSASHFLTADAGSISALTKALGFVSVYDRDRDQFAHPAAAFVVAPGGRVARALPGLAVDPATIRLAIVDAGKGTVGTLTDHIRLLCYGYDPASGTYSVAIGRILAAAGGVTIAALMLLIGLLLRSSRPAPQPAADGLHCAAQSRTSTTE